MLGLKNYFSRTRRMEKDNTISAMEEFIQQFYWAQTMAQKQSCENISRSIVEITDLDNNHMSNGILITDNGYFLTANHCISEGIRNLRARMSEKETYPIKEVCAISQEHDLALVKAEIPDECRSKSYKLFDGNQNGFPSCKLVTRWDREIKEAYGIVFADYSNFQNQETGEIGSFMNRFHLSIPIIKGDSGGSIVSPKGQLMGIITDGVNPKIKQAGEFQNSACSKIIKAVELVYFYKRLLEGS